MEIITSASNKIIKHIKSLHLRKNREENSEFFVEGLRFVNEAFASDYEISQVVISESFYDNYTDERRMVLDRYKTTVISDKLFLEISDTNSPQGIMAIVKMRKNEQDRSLQKVVILDGIQDPGNMGTIIRSADAFALSCIVISDGCVDVYNPKVLRATMGSIFHIPVYKSEDITRFIAELKEAEYTVYAAHLDGEDLACVRGGGKSALIIGNEANGIRGDVSSLANCLVRIPMPGRAESLNASVAASILMYEIYCK